ncbi:hypothetical protein BGZ95_007452 [Linnemannia exigua]|uniref:Uncharacterized protein n=1 Tax=Linnemannia exigua TaxID=604196 RepID=A0AAD4H901_9FUNG|nr:hypothetical protein BGZ95_007452 [Linnemannia exigua]
MRAELVDDFRAYKDAYIDDTRAMVAESRTKTPSLVSQILESNGQTLEWEDETPESEADVMWSFVISQLGSVFAVATQRRLIPYVVNAFDLLDVMLSIRWLIVILSGV